jgi:hypothetical protein
MMKKNTFAGLSHLPAMPRPLTQQEWEQVIGGIGLFPATPKPEPWALQLILAPTF